MNVKLVPYAWPRHILGGLLGGAVCLIAWWGLVLWWGAFGPSWPAKWDGGVLLALIATSAASTSVFLEGALFREHPAQRATKIGIAGGVTLFFSLLGFWCWDAGLGPMIFDGFGDKTAGVDARDATLVTIRYRLGAFVLVGLATAVGPLSARRGKFALQHLGAGLAAGLGAVAVWGLLHMFQVRHLYLASAGLAVSWGFLFCALSWAIPDSLYAGWIRVLSPHDFGRRVPVDGLDHTPRERFVGHWPIGLDMFQPLEGGVYEMHMSAAVDSQQRYKARGLTLAPTRVKRFLESVDLRYDARRPAPLETRLRSGDRIFMGEGPQQTVLEFVMLPREEE